MKQIKLFNIVNPKSADAKRSSDLNTKKQLKGLPIAIDQLRKMSVDDETALMIEFFFYANTLSNANNLAGTLATKGYVVYDRIAVPNNRFGISGHTQKMKIEHNTMADWVKEMCYIGLQHDCEFDGWGTSPEMK